MLAVLCGKAGLVRNIVDLIGIFIIWVMYLVGAAIATHYWKGLTWCDLRQCNVVTSILAFTWISWSFATFLLLCAIGGLFKTRGTGGYRRGASATTGPGGRQYEARAADDRPVTTGAPAPAVA